METFALVVAFILIFVLFRQTSRLRKELDETRHEFLKRSAKASAPEETMGAVEPAAVASEVFEPAPEPKVLVTWERPTAERVERPPVEEKKPGYFSSSEWKRTERFLLENLTGILGALGVVLGLGFLGVYTALMLDPIFRVLLLTTLALIIVAVAGFFLRTGRWTGLAQWSQSAGLAVFLLACLGSGGIPGLKWIDDPLMAFGLLATGVFANLGLAFFRKSVLFASVHAVLALAALAVAGPSTIIVVTMALVAVGSVLLIRGSGWEIHLALTESVFVGVLILFYFTGSEPTEVLRLVTTVSLIVVFCVGQATHYRKVHSNSTWDTSAGLTHLLFWSLTCAGLFLYAPHNDLILAPCLLAVSVFVGMVARLARRRGILWLYKIDTLFSFASAFGAVLSLMAWQLALTPAILLLLVVSLAFTLLMIVEGEALLARIGTRTTELLSVVVAGLSVAGSDAIALAIAGVLLGTFQALLAHRIRTVASPRSLYDLLLPWLFVTSALVSPSGQNALGLLSGYALLLPLLGMFLWQRARSSKLLHLGLLTASVGFSVFEWGKLLLSVYLGPQSLWLSLLVCGPMILIPLAGVVVSKSSDQDLRRRLLWVFGANLAVSAFVILGPVSPWALPLAWVFLGVGILWVPSVRPTNLGKDIHLLGLTLIAGGLILYGPLVLSPLSSLAWGPFKWSVELLIVGLLATTYWTRHFRRPTGQPTIDGIAPLFLEVSLLVVLATAFFEVPGAYLATAVALGSTLLLGVSALKRSEPRLVAYAFWGFLLSTVILVWASVTRAGGPELWLAATVQTAWLAGIFAVKWPVDEDFPPVVRWLGEASTPFFQRLPLFSVLPLGVSWALCLAFTFDSTLLTLMWSLESFGLFVLALVLREPLFRTLSLSALGICLVRLVFFDLVQADTLSRALVFLGVGFLLILMNILYTRFKSRVAVETQEEETPPTDKTPF